MKLAVTFFKVKILIFIILISLLGGVNIISAQSVTSTYTAGDIPTNFNVYSATCNGPVTALTITIPAGSTVTSVDVYYEMTADPPPANGWMSEQNSQIYCAETGNDEGGYSFGSGNYAGTLAYSRTGLSLANGVSATGTLTFQMRAIRDWRNNSYPVCDDNVNRVDNNTWAITVYYTVPPPFPGGVGTSSNIALWLKADDGPLNTGSGIASTDGQATNTWTDNSTTRTNDATDANSTAPTFRNNSTDNINFNPTVDFNGTSHGLNYGSDYIYSTGSGSQDGMTWFAVVEPDNPGVTNKVYQFVVDFGRFSNRGYGFYYGNTNYGMYTSSSYSGSNQNQPHTNGLTTTLSRFTIDFGTNQTLNLNGEIIPSITDVRTPNQLTASEINERSSSSNSKGPVTIGRQSRNGGVGSNSGRRLDGSISEIIGFTKDLSAIDIRRVESYLAVKYGITLDNTGGGVAGDYESSAGTTIWDASSNLAYHNDVFGVGRDDNSALGQVKSHSINTGGVAIFEAEGEGINSNNSFVDIEDDEFLIAGNNGFSTAYTQSGVFPLYKNRTNRVWKTQSTGQLGLITVNIILANTGVTADYGLHTDLDSDFTAGATNYICNSISGDTLIFTNVSFTSGSAFFTIGYQEARYAVATSPHCGAINISDTIKTVALETALLWLKSNKGTSTSTDGVAISDWNDNSTNANHVTQPTSGNRPTFRDNVTDNFNFNPTIEFVNDHLLKAAPGIFVSGATYTNINTYMVFKDKDLSSFNWMVHEGNSGFDRFSFSANYSGGIHSAYDLTTSTRMVSPSPSAGITNLYSFNTGTSAVYGTASNQRRVYSLNGTQTLTNNTFPGFIGTNNTFFIGNITGVADAPAPFDGYFGEILIIEDEVSLIKHQQIETYLAIKYGITLGHDYLNSDTNVIYDISNGYANGIFGIGRSSAFDLYQPRSRSETAYSGVTIEATVSIGEENYLIIGHDGGSLTTITLAGQTNVLTRKWFAKMHKGIGTISMELDLATIGASTGLSASNVKIGVSNSASFARTKWIEATTVVGGVAYFTGIPLYDKYFTFSAAP